MQTFCFRNKLKYRCTKNKRKDKDDKPNRQSAKIKKLQSEKMLLELILLLYFVKVSSFFQSGLSMNSFVSLFRFYEFFQSGFRWVVY